MLPAKDGWWTTPDQPGNPYKDNRTENLGPLHGAIGLRIDAATQREGMWVHSAGSTHSHSPDIPRRVPLL